MRRTGEPSTDEGTATARPPGWPLPASAATRIVLALAGVGAGLVLASSWATIRSPFDAGLAVVIVVGLVSGILGWVPALRLEGRLGAFSYLSYGAVLLLFLLLTPDRVGADRASLLWTRLACGAVLAVVLLRVFDSPSRHRALHGWKGMAVLGLLPGLVGATVLAAHGLPGADAGAEAAMELAVGGEPDGGVAAALTFPTEGPTAVTPGTEPTIPVGEAPAATGVGPAATPSGGRPAAARTASTAAAATPSTATPAPPPAPAPARAVKVLVAGESTAGATGGGMRTWGHKNGRAQVDVVGTNGCALQQDGTAYWRDGWAQPTNGSCLNLIDYTVDVATRSQPDLIVLFIGSNQLSDWVLPGQTAPSFIGQPAFDQLYANAATAALRKLTSLGIPVLFTDTAVPSWDPAVQTGNPTYPGTGPLKMNDAGRTRRLNELTAGVVRSLPLTAMVPYAQRISNPDGSVSTTIRPDGIHLLQSAVPGIMDRGLEADLRSSYQQVTGRVASSARGGAHQWSRA